MSRDRTAFRRWLLALHVADWQRWQRTKTIAAVTLVLAAMIAIGGTEWDPSTPDDAHYGLAWLLLAAAGALIWNIEHRRR